MDIRHLLLPLLLAAAGCGTRGDAWDRPFETDGPVAAAGQVAFLQRTAGVLGWIDPTRGGPPSHRDVTAHARAFAPWAEGVLVAGGRGDAPVLEVVRLPAGTLRRIPLDAAWDRIEVAPDGTRAILLFGAAGTAPVGAAPVRNPNEVAVVDPAAGTATTVIFQTEALAPREVVFADGSPLVAILFDNAIALVDAARPERLRTIPLKLRDGAALRPAQAFFSPGGGFLFVQAAGTDDVIALEIAAGGEALDVAINFLFAAGLSDLQAIAVAPPLGEAVVALYRDGAALLDAAGDTSATRSVALASFHHRILDLGDGILLFHPAPGRSDLGIAAWEPRAGRVVIDRLEKPIVAEPVVAGTSAFLPQGTAESGALTVATVVREPARLRLSLQALQLAGVPTAAIADPASGVAFFGLDLLRGFTAADDEERTGTGAIAAVAAGSLGSGGVRVDAPVLRLGIAGGHLFAIHDAPLGDLTLVPRGDLRREAAVRYEGIFASGLLDRGEE